MVMLTYLQRLLGITAFDGKLFRRLLTPSWAGGVTYVFISVATVGTLMALSQYNGSLFEHQLYALNLSLERTVAENPYDDYAGSPGSLDTIVSGAFTLLIWGSMAALIYLCGVALIGSVRASHSPRFTMATVAFVHLVLRGLALCLLVLAIWVFIKVIVLYAFTTAYVTGIDAPGLQGTGLILLAITLLIAGLHMLVVCLRLFLLRPRIFHSTVYN